MIRKLSVQIVLLLAGLSSGSLFAGVHYQWGSTTGSVAWNGTATGGLLEQSNPAFHSESVAISYDGVTTVAQAGIFKPTAADDLTIHDKVKIKGDIEIRFEGNGNPATKETFYIDVKTLAGGATKANIAAFADATTTVDDYAQLVFNPAQGKSIHVNLFCDLAFQSADAVAPGVAMPLYVSFRGQGSTIFRLPSGRSLTFGPPNEGKVGDTTLSAEGVHIRILMDQSSLDAYGKLKTDGTGYEIKPVNQLTFEKWSHGTDFFGDGVNVNTGLDTWIRLGQHSSLAYVSPNYHGIAEKWVDLDKDGEIDIGEPIPRAGYGSVAFDPSNAAAGRLILDLARGQAPAGNDFTDAAVNVCGAFVVPTLAGADRRAPVILNRDLREYVYFNQRAGVRAIFRVTDEVAQHELLNAASPASRNAWKIRSDASRRGLCIINNNNSIPKFANNMQLSSRIDLNPWAKSNNYQPGFVLGINGELVVDPHLFIHHMANNINRSFITSVHTPGSSAHTSDVIKLRNPAALFVDGLFNEYAQPTQFAVDDYGVPISDLLYIGSRDDYGVHAKITLYGDGGLYTSCIAPYNPADSALPQPDFVQAKLPKLYYLPESPVSTSLVMTVVLGIGKYDGTHVPVLDAGNAYVMQSTLPEGCHAMCIEGPLLMTSWDGAFAQPANGFFKVPSLRLDYAGRETYYTNYNEWLAWLTWRAWYESEVTDGSGDTVPIYRTEVPLDDGTIAVFDSLTSFPSGPSSAPLVDRPIPLNKYCAVYNIASVLVNDSWSLDRVRYIHDDVTRNLAVPDKIPYVGARSRPHIVGGELAGLYGKLRPPKIELFNATIECRESLVMSGVALTLTELPTSAEFGQTVADSHNVSRIVFYNRGREYDTNGYGRVLQLGSQGNVAADGETTSDLFASAYLDAYRKAPTTGATAQTPSVIRLSLETAQALGAGEKSLHSIYLANESQIVLGWPTLEGDSGYAPSDFDTTILQSLQRSDPLNRRNYRFSTYETGVAELRMSGGPLFIGAGDAMTDLPPERPVPGIDVGGVLYVNHGGRIAVTGSNDLFINTVLARRVAASAAASGQLTIPSDQAHFLPSGIVQNYDIDFSTDRITDGPLAGHIKLSPQSQTQLIDVNRVFAPDGFEGVK